LSIVIVIFLVVEAVGSGVSDLLLSPSLSLSLSFSSSDELDELGGSSRLFPRIIGGGSNSSPESGLGGVLGGGNGLLLSGVMGPVGVLCILERVPGC
jgi:hypothetical protein